MQRRETDAELCLAENVDHIALTRELHVKTKRLSKCVIFDKRFTYLSLFLFTATTVAGGETLKWSDDSRLL